MQVKRLDATPHVATLPVERSVPARHQAVQISLHRFTRPVALCAREVRGGPAIKRRQREHLARPQRRHPTSCRHVQKSLEPLPLVTPSRNELFRSHSARMIS